MSLCYKLLFEFTNGSTPCQTHLLRRYGEKILIEHVLNGYIVEIGSNTAGETIYAITEKGKHARDD